MSLPERIISAQRQVIAHVFNWHHNPAFLRYLAHDWKDGRVDGSVDERLWLKASAAYFAAAAEAEAGIDPCYSACAGGGR